MDEQRARIHEDLRGFFEGELVFDPLGRAPYTCDAGLFEVDPLGVVAPRSEADLIGLLRYSAEHGLPVHPRGAGTGRTGGAVGPGLVVDLARHFRRVVDIGPECVTVQSGVVLDRLNAQLAPLGRRIGPDPEGSESHTIGGLIGLDSAGPRSLRHGTFATHVERLRVVFASGEVGVLSRVEPSTVSASTDGFRSAVAHRLGVLLSWNADSLARASAWPGASPGYAIGDLASEQRPLDLARLVVGAEGTLAIVTEATLRTVPIPTAQAVLVAPFARLIDAAESVPDCLAERPSACELLDRRSLTLARDLDPFLHENLSEHAEAVLIVEFEDDTLHEALERARSLASSLERVGDLIDEPRVVSRKTDCDRLVTLGRLIRPPMARLRGPSRPVSLVERLRVPPDRLAEFLVEVQHLLRREGLGWSLDAHAGLAELRVQPYLDLSCQADRDRVVPLAAALRQAAHAVGGTVSPGLGPDRIAAIRRQQGPLFNAHRELKYTFDPLNLLNPGKFVGDEAKPIPASLRAVPTVEPETWSNAGEATPVLRRADRPRLEQIAACNNCGACRTEEPTLRMCPTFRASHDEAASPRAKVHVLRQIAAGRLDPRFWGSDELKAHADLCVHCNLCEPECPAGVDVSGLMLDAKAAYVADHGLAPDDWALSRVDVWSSWAARVPTLFNALMNSRLARWLLERTFGLARHRSLPRARRVPFLRRAERLGLTKPRPHEPGPRAAYFVDIFANTFDPELAESVVAVLRHAGVNVFVPKPQRGSGMPALVAGDFDRARDIVELNLRALGNAARDGYTIVCSEPTAALMLRREALRLTDDLDAALVASSTMDVGQYLAGLVQRGDLRRPEHPIPARVGYHQPCHLRALGVGTPGLDLIRSIPGLDVEFIDRGCSGMAGTFGLAARNFRTALRAGRGLLRRLRDDDLQLGATECSACRLQMEQVVAKRTLHPFKLLSLGYGLNPLLRRHLVEPKPEREIA